MDRQLWSKVSSNYVNGEDRMKRNFGQLMTLLAVFPFSLAACSSGGGAGAVATTASAPTSSPTPAPAVQPMTPAPTIFVPANFQPPNTTRPALKRRGADGPQPEVFDGWGKLCWLVETARNAQQSLAFEKGRVLR